MNSGPSPTKLSPVHASSQELGAQFAAVAGWQVPQVYTAIADEVAAVKRSVALADNSASGKIVVEGKGAAAVLQAAWSMPSLATGQGEMVDAGRVYRLREDQFFVHLDPGAEGAAAEALDEAAGKTRELVSVTDVTHGRADLLLVGPHSARLLSRLCGLDLESSQFPDLGAQQSSVAKTRQLVLRCDIKPQDGSPVLAYSLIGDRSLAVYLWQTIREAGHDLDLALIGRAALDELRTGE